MPNALVSIAAGFLAALLGCASPGPDLGSLPVRPLDRCGIGAGGRSLVGLDLAIAIDASTSTSRPSGMDVDGDGTVGVFRRSATSDRGDSLLAAQVLAVKSLVEGGLLPDARVTIVAYSGRIEAPSRSTAIPTVTRREARTLAGLTSDRATLELALERALAQGSRGAADFAAAVELSLRNLRAGEGPDGPRRRIILLMSDSPTPILGAPSLANFRTLDGGDPNGTFLRHDPDLATVARRAIRHRATLHTFGLGSAAADDPPHALSHLAEATGGTYRGVRDARRLDCDLLGALAGRPPAPADRGARS